jgi:hypothetical protein
MADKNFIDKFKEKGKFQRPKAETKDDKDRNYFVTTSEAIFSSYVRGVDAVRYGAWDSFSSLRQYGSGTQSENTYKPMMGLVEDKSNGSSATLDSEGNDIGGGGAEFDVKEFSRKALAHINWEVMSPMPKLKNKILAGINDNAYDIVIECVDENSIDSQLNNKWKAWVESQADTIAFLQASSQATGIPYTPPADKVETIEELELHEANGEFKLNYSKEGEKLIKDAENISNINEIDEKVVNDIVDINIGAYRVEYDRKVGKEMFRYVDPSYAGIQHSKHRDFRDSSYAYELTFIPAHELQSLGLDISEIPVIVSKYAGLYGNPEIDSKIVDRCVENRTIQALGFYKVPVLDLEWIDVDVTKKVKRTNKRGKVSVHDFTQGEKMTANKQYLETKKDKVYQCRWILDTDIVYDYGLKPNQPTKEKDQSMLSFHFIKGKTTKSITEQLIPILDDFQLSWLKFQDGKAQAVKAGYSINWDAIAGLSTGGKKMTPMNVYKIFKLTGDMFWRRPSKFQTQGGMADPVKALGSGQAGVIGDLVLALDTNAKLIEEITGINPVALGATAQPNAGKAVTELAVSASASPVLNIYSKLFQLKGHAALDLLTRAQLDMRNSKTVAKRYTAVIGEFGVRTLIEAEGKGVTFGSNMVARPTAEDKAVILESAKIALANGRDGKPGINVSDYLYIVRRLNEGGNLKELGSYIDFKIRKSQEMMDQSAQQNQQLNTQGQLEVENKKTENFRTEKQIETESQIAIDNNKAQLDVGLEQVKSENKKEEIRVQNSTKPPQANKT